MIKKNLNLSGHGHGSLADVQNYIGAQCFDLAPELWGGTPRDLLAREVTFHNFGEVPVSDEPAVFGS